MSRLGLRLSNGARARWGRAKAGGGARRPRTGNFRLAFAVMAVVILVVMLLSQALDLGQQVE